MGVEGEVGGRGEVGRAGRDSNILGVAGMGVEGG